MLFTYLILCAFLYFLFKCIQSWSFLRHLRGPFLASFSNLWHFNAFYGAQYHIEYHKAIRQYGDLVRVSPNEVITANPELIRKMNGVRSQYRRGQWYTYARPDAKTSAVFTETDIKTHDMLRSQLKAGYSGTEIPDLEQKIEACIWDLFKLIDSKYLSTDSDLKPVDLGMKIPYFTMDVITSLGYGKAFGYLTEDKDVFEYFKNMSMGIPIALGTAYFPWFARALKNPVVTGIIGDAPTGIMQIKDLAKEVTDARYGPNKTDERDMLGTFVRNGLQQSQAPIEVFSQLIAGSDTTATALRTTLLYTFSNPSVLAKLRAEVDEAAKSHGSSPIGYADALKLPYLQACIKENLRIFPPFVGQNPKQVPKGGDTVNGVFLPEGTQVLTAVYTVQRDEKVFGEHTEVFRPERWLEADEDRLHKMQELIDLVFGYGRTSCLGKGVAMMEINKALFEIIKRYDITFLDPIHPMQSEARGIFLQRNMWSKVSKRSL